MVNTAKIKEIIALYKADFARIDNEERYKWIAIKHFQDHWDIEAPDFANMLERAFSKHVNLLDVGVARPLGNMVFFARRDPETVRDLYKALFDETQLLKNRISDFISGVELFVSKMNQEDAGWKSTFQDQHAISVYLTFRHPENYYIYKYSILKVVAPMFGIESASDRMSTYILMCDAIREVAMADTELISMSHERLGSDCYQDPNNRLLATDIAFYAYHLQLEKIEEQNIVKKPAIVKDFKKWLESQTRNNGKPYDYKTVKVYLKQIENEAKKLASTYEGNINLYTYDTSASFAPHLETLMHMISTGEGQVNGAFTKVLRLYEQFLKERDTPGSPPPTQPVDPPVDPRIIYSRDKFLEEVFLTADNYDSLINQLIRKKNLIIQGAPGVGKTFAAKRLAYSLIGEKSSERIGFVQFHQSYGYEDFVMGYRPNGNGFELKDGAFYSFCKQAVADPENDWYFIIDEINRGNISKIFGELLMLVEADKRGKDYAVRLQGTDELFYVPDNVYIIGMMNTADRSIALIDYALRRRFAFYTLEPAFENENFRDYVESKNSDNFNTMIELVSKLNDEIAADPLLGVGYKIGHSYFCTEDPVDGKLLQDIILYEIKPLLSEYWVDDADKVQEWTVKLLEAV
ncbi:MAG: AAA family ATPase [Bacillota bacterium]|nr:AAA family ATPase [Bacillota bacterium]